MSKRPTIYISEENTNENLDILDDAFADSHESLRIFQRSGAVVQIRENPEHAVRNGKLETVWTPQIARMEKEHVQQAANEAVEFVKFDARSNEMRPAACREELARLYLRKRTEWELPVLRAIINRPTLRADGSILARKGFDKASGILFLSDHKFPAIPDAPTPRDVHYALLRLTHVVRGFEFEDDAAKAVWLACVLTAIIRPSLPSAPVFGFDAPMAGSGKTKLAHGASIIAQGFAAAPMNQAATNEEEEKRLFSLLMRGAPFVFIDNCTEPLKSPQLCAISTAPEWSCRVLGKSDSVTVPTYATIMATGNGLRFAGDLTTRALTCRLTPKTDAPEERQFAFSFEDECLRQRPALVAAALTIARGYIAGRERIPGRSRFPEWDSFVRQPLINAGLPDVLGTMRRSQEEDEDRTNFGRLVEAWRAAFGSKPMRLKQVASQADEFGDAGEAVMDALIAVAPSKANARAFDSRALGEYLRTNLDRYHDGLVLRSHPDPKHGARWHVEHV